MLNQKFLDKLICPGCGDGLTQEKEKLVCSGCKKKFDIHSGIPVLIDIDEIPEHLKNQIKYFENEKRDDKEHILEPWQKSYLQKFNENIKDIKDKEVFDCGVGSAYMSIELAKMGANVIGCDLTLKNLIRLKRISEKLGIADKIELVCCSAEKLPIKDKTFDVFISNAVLEHLPKEQQAIDEINRTTKDDADFMICVPLSYKYINPLFLPLNYVHDQKIGHLRRYDEKILEDKFEGRKLKNTYYTGHFVKTAKTLVNMTKKIFDEQKIEDTDATQTDKKYGASNIICFFKK